MAVVKVEASGSPKLRGEVDKETADCSADYAKLQGALDKSTLPTAYLNVTGGPERMLKIFKS